MLHNFQWTDEFINLWWKGELCLWLAAPRTFQKFNTQEKEARVERRHGQLIIEHEKWADRLISAMMAERRPSSDLANFPRPHPSLAHDCMEAYSSWRVQNDNDLMTERPETSMGWGEEERYEKTQLTTFNYLRWACRNDVITTPTLLEQCGMVGSCCIEARVEIVLRLTPPSEPASRVNF